MANVKKVKIKGKRDFVTAKVSVQKGKTVEVSEIDAKIWERRGWCDIVASAK